MGVECLRLLNEIIADFDEVNTFDLEFTFAAAGMNFQCLMNGEPFLC